LERNARSLKFRINALNFVFSDFRQCCSSKCAASGDTPSCSTRYAGAVATEPLHAFCIVEEIDAGLQLATVSAGDVLGFIVDASENCYGLLGPADTSDQVPLKPTGKRAGRKAGVAVRANWLYYGVTGDGAVDAERLRSEWAQKALLLLFILLYIRKNKFFFFLHIGGL